MVLVTTPGLPDLQAGLADLATDNPTQPPHARAFAIWVQADALEPASALRSLGDDAATAQGASRQSQHVAVLGYAASLDSVFVQPFFEALTWLRERQFFVSGRPLAFEIDGLALLGVAAGIARLNPAERAPAQSWLQELITRSLSSRRRPDWNESLITAALAVLTGNINGGTLADDLRTALAAKGLVPASREAQRVAGNLILGLTAAPDGMTRGAAQLAALKFLLRVTSTLNFNAVSIDNVAALLDGVARSMRRWAWDPKPRTPKSAVARWDIENEYHVQDMLWAILAPIFPDLDDEEWLTSLGHHRPRADLAIPSLDLIVEVKFLRPGPKTVFSEVIQQVATDASTYLTEGSGYRHIIAFVWDDAARTEEHAELAQGLERITGVHKAIVLPRPSKMVRAVGGDDR